MGKQKPQRSLPSSEKHKLKKKKIAKAIEKKKKANTSAYDREKEKRTSSSGKKDDSRKRKRPSSSTSPAAPAMAPGLEKTLKFRKLSDSKSPSSSSSSSSKVSKSTSSHSSETKTSKGKEQKFKEETRSWKGIEEPRKEEKKWKGSDEKKDVKSWKGKEEEMEQDQGDSQHPASKKEVHTMAHTFSSSTPRNGKIGSLIILFFFFSLQIRAEKKQKKMENDPRLKYIETAKRDWEIAREKSIPQEQVLFVSFRLLSPFLLPSPPTSLSLSFLYSSWFIISFMPLFLFADGSSLASPCDRQDARYPQVALS
jgi:hypothetical protein